MTSPKLNRPLRTIAEARNHSDAAYISQTKIGAQMIALIEDLADANDRLDDTTALQERARRIKEMMGK